MKGEGLLLTLAQLGLALAGFAGLISVFRQTGRAWIPQELAGMKWIFEHTFAEVFFAVLPFPLFYLLDSEPGAWKISSATLACFIVFNILINLQRSKKLMAQGTPPRRIKAFLYFFLPVTLIVLALQILNSINWGGAANYIWGLLWLLVAPSIQFFHFILSFEESDSDKNGKPTSNK